MPSPRRFTLKLIFDSKTFDEKTLRRPQWMKDRRRLAYLDEWPDSERLTVWIYDSETGERKPLFDPKTLCVQGAKEPQTVHAFQWSPDERRLLLPAEAPARFKPCGNLFLYDLETAAFRRLTDTDLPQRNAFFSPDGRWVGVVRADNLRLLSTETGEERQLTFDATETVYNGRFGWVYEEELGLVEGWAWSPSGDRIAFFQQDESDVPEVLLPQYDDLHATPLPTRYPKAGDPNPRVRIGVLTVATGETRWLDLEGVRREAQGVSEEQRGGDRETGRQGDKGEDSTLNPQPFPLTPHASRLTPHAYLARMQWTPDGKGLLLQRIPRLQNRIELLYADVATGAVRPVLAEEDAAWVDPQGDVTFVEGTDQFLWRSDRDGWRHLYLYDLSGKCLRQVTAGEWDVDEIAGLDVQTRTVFFTAARPAPTERHLYRALLDGGEPVCLTTETPGCNRALFTEDGTRYLHTHSTSNTPPTITLRDAEGTLCETLISDPLPKRNAFVWSEWEHLTFTTSDGETLYAKMLKPHGFEATHRYPVLMYTYGGPGSQVVTDAWGVKGALWYQLLAQQGYVVFMVDNRGTGMRGRVFKKQVYLQLGKWEVHDQIEGAKYLAGLPFIDPQRIGIWGWSYGGYTASLCMLKGAGVFRAGIAVAPVTDWALYDSIYTERYMRCPEDNPDGYKEGAPVTHAAKLRGRFLLIHGTLDDNVHFQNAARLASALQDAKKRFATMFYPGKRHSIEDRHFHVYMTMTEFLRKNL